MLSFDEDEDELTPASNAVIDLIRAGKLDEAEQAARDLLQRFPEVHDGYDRLGMVYEARGDNQQAVFYYYQLT
jgi:tetratricopeptide (TPR) repeat protein